MTPKEKITKLAIHMVSGVSTDAAIMATGLSEDDLDKYWSHAELVAFKARTKPEVTPTGEALITEIKSWIDYFHF